MRRPAVTTLALVTHVTGTKRHVAPLQLLHLNIVICKRGRIQSMWLAVTRGAQNLLLMTHAVQICTKYTHVQITRTLANVSVTLTTRRKRLV